MTPDPFVCLYQAVEVRNSDESLWLCVYTPESRKEGNQPRSAKSGEVRENSCSAPELQWFTSARQDLSHVISTAETSDQHKTATVTALSTGGGEATEKTEAARTGAKSGHYEERIEFSIEYFHVAAHPHLHEHGHVQQSAVIAYSSFYVLSWCNPKANKSFCCWSFSLIDFNECTMQHSRTLTKAKVFM